MIAIIIDKRAMPIYWEFLDKKGCSNLAEQQQVLRPVLQLFSEYQIFLLGDREFIRSNHNQIALQSDIM
jgi:hypothetical protein